MGWNFHNYYANRSNGLISYLNLSEEDHDYLINLRNKVRVRIRDVFEETKKLVKTNDFQLMSLTESTQKIRKTKLGYLSDLEQHQLYELFKDMSESVKQEFLNLSPRFWTQGSFQYKTLNFPYNSPPQEMDIDDGVYLPMNIFEEVPVIGHKMLILLVDSALKSLEKENEGWKFDGTKETCARIKIPSKNVHIDVPMYAIPKDKFLEKEEAIVALSESSKGIVMDHKMISEERKSYYKLDSSCVNLLLRNKKKWMNSDPKIVDDWFNNSCKRIGENINTDDSKSYHVRKICRFIKAWRDVQWVNGGGPSSIALMAAIIEILNKKAHDPNNFGTTIEIIAQDLADEFKKGVESPDPTDEKQLFPAENSKDYGAKEEHTIQKISELNTLLQNAKVSTSKEIALFHLNQAFGKRVNDPNLIIKPTADDVISQPVEILNKPIKITPAVKSG